MPSELCISCRKIPLEPGMKTLDADGYRGPTTWNLGSFGQVRRRSCPFCELVTSTCSGSRFSWDKPTPPNDSVSIDLRWGNYGFATNQSPLGSYICIASQDPETERYYARARLPEWIDFDDVLGWISSCEQDHPRNGDYECSPGAYNLAVLPRNNRRQLDFRLIDVESLCIVYAPRECKYVALSYVWGQSKKKRLVLTSKNEEALMEPRALDDVQTRGSIPNTIWDAMSVVRKLGERYLWVDSLCLLQDDRDELQDCVSIMDLFYDMALLTIVAGSGEDAWSGLPGVAPTARGIKPFIRFIKHGLTMTSIMGVDLLLRQSVYSSRAWTMQEEILSRRLLVFINGQVYYQCANGEFSEAQNWSGQRRPSSGLHVSLYSTLLLYPDITFSQFSTMITYYTSRTLSFQNDVLRASQGMLQKLAMLSGARSFEGLPAPLDRSLVFELLGSPRNKQVDRRQSFPSYSWTGWMNAVRYDHRLESPENISRDDSIDKNDPVLRGWIIWHCTLEDGKVYRIDDTGRLRKRLLLTVEDTQSKSREAFQKIPVSASDINFTAIRATSYPLLLFWTICVNLCLTRRPTSYEITDKIDPRIVENRHAFDVIDRYGTKCGTADIASTMPEAAEGKFALLTMYEGYFWAILLGWEDDIAERRGVARLSAEAIEVCLDPGPRWKAIVLG